MRRVVVTGMGIVSCLGNAADAVSCALSEARSGIRAVPEYAVRGLRSQIAGVPQIAIVTPPTADGSVDAATLVAARLAGVGTVYKCGGAQAVAAVAYGTETVKPALKIVGPGSPWVVAAKSVLSSIINTGLPAGPSEAIIFADDSVDGGLAALDLLIEAEHGPDSSAYLVTHSRKVAEEGTGTERQKENAKLWADAAKVTLSDPARHGGKNLGGKTPAAS